MKEELRNNNQNSDNVPTFNSTSSMDMSSPITSRLPSTFSVSNLQSTEMISSNGLYAIKKSTEFKRSLRRFIDFLSNSEYNIIVVGMIHF